MAVLTPRVLCCFYAGFYGTGGHSGEVIPVPFPNTEVKLPCADDTASRWESRSPPVPSFFNPAPTSRAACCCTRSFCK